MNLQRLFPAIVQGVLLGSTLTSCANTYNDEYHRRVNRGPMCQTSPTAAILGPVPSNDTVAPALEAILAERPDATPEAQLRALYANGGERIRGANNEVPLTAQTFELMSAVAGTNGALPQNLCSFLCTNVMAGQGRADTFTGCSVRGKEPSQRLYCNYEEEICHPAGRRFDGLEAPTHAPGSPLGQAWAHIAYSEQAAVHAFAALAGELTAHGAPQTLIQGCVQAAFDEVVHTKMAAAMALRHGASDVPTPGHASTQTRSLLELATENALEGCIREAYAALETTWQAAHTEGEEAEVFATIARDETRHAELSWRIHAWAMPQLSHEERSEITRAMEESCETLGEELAARAEAWEDARLGLPTTDQALAMLGAMRQELLAA